MNTTQAVSQMTNFSLNDYERIINEALEDEYLKSPNKEKVTPEWVKLWGKIIIVQKEQIKRMFA